MKNEEKQIKIAENYAQIMKLLGIKESDDNRDTPKRYAKMIMEQTESLDRSLSELVDVCTVFEAKSRNVEVKQSDIEFSSLCSHHHAPFFGKVEISYVPTDDIIGLSKFKRVIDFFAKKPQVQEELTHEIGDFLVGLLNPKILTVRIYDTHHTCMSCRGVHSKASTETTYKFNNW